MTKPLHLCLAAGLFLTPALRAADPAAPAAKTAAGPTDDQQLLDVFKKLLSCDSHISHHKIPAGAHLITSHRGDVQSDESLEGFDDLTVIILSGPGLAGSPPTGKGSLGYRIIVTARNTLSPPQPIAPGSDVTLTVKSRTWEYTYTEPDWQPHHGLATMAGATPIFHRTDRENSTGKILNHFLVEMTTTGKPSAIDDDHPAR
ncbi:MAG: hypothetical protein JWO82_1777 [Akkermansiaceae bacterium]|nr:hypothetical protein [Akkermansiaceae bacterium]